MDTVGPPGNVVFDFLSQKQGANQNTYQNMKDMYEGTRILFIYLNNTRADI